MAYGIIKVDTVTFTDAGIDKSVSISGLVQNPTFSGNVTVTGIVSGNTIQGQTISGVTVTGTTSTFATGSFVSLTGTTIQGTTASYTSGSFTSLTGVTTSGTTANFVSGVFSTQISGTTVTGTTASFTSGVFTNISGGTHTITSGVFAVGSAASPSISFTSDPDTGVYSPGANQVALSTNGTERLRITSAGLVGIGTTAPGELLTVGGAAANIGIFNTTLGSSASPSSSKINFYGYSQTANGNIASISAVNTQLNTFGGVLQFATNTALGSHTTAVTIDSSQRVGIGTTSPSQKLEVVINDTTSQPAILIGNGDGSARSALLRNNNDATSFDIIASNSASVAKAIRFMGVASSEYARIDSSGRLLVGTSTARAFQFGLTPLQQIETATGSNGLSITTNRNDSSSNVLHFGKSRSAALGGVGIVSSNDSVGTIRFEAADGTQLIRAAEIRAEVDGTPGANDMPGRLVFSVTADGASSPTEAMRIKNSRILNFANTPVYADNAAAKTGGLVDGDVYRKSDGTLMIVYT